MIKQFVAFWALVCFVTPGLCSAGWTLVFRNGKVAQITGYQVEDQFIHVTDQAGTIFTLKISDIDVEKTNSMNDHPIVFSDDRSVLEAHAVNKVLSSSKTGSYFVTAPPDQPSLRGLFESNQVLSFPVAH